MTTILEFIINIIIFLFISSCDSFYETCLNVLTLQTIFVDIVKFFTKTLNQESNLYSNDLVVGKKALGHTFRKEEKPYYKIWEDYGEKVLS